MAQSKNNILDPVSGKIGNILFRQRYGKEVAYHMPETYKISYSALAVEGRAKFGNTVKLARLINSNPKLHSIWERATIKGVNSYQKIIKLNSKYTSHKGLTKQNILVPPGIQITNPTLSVDKESIIIELSILEAIKFTKLEGILLISNFSYGKVVNSVTHSIETKISGNRIFGSFHLDKLLSLIIQQNRVTIILCTLIFENSNGIPLAWTDTIPFELGKSAKHHRTC